MIESPVEREYYLKELSDEYDISLDTLKNEIHVNQQKMTPREDKRKKSRYTNKASNFYQTKKLLPASHNAERQIIEYMLQYMSITAKAQKELGEAFAVD